MTPETREALKEFARATKWAIAEADIDLTKYCILEDCANRLIRALEQEPDGRVEKLDKLDQQCDYETWRDEQLGALRTLWWQLGPGNPYKSFPDFCRDQYEGSDKGKVKI